MRKTILFVGSQHKANQKGFTGGTMVACQMLLESELEKFYKWIVIDCAKDSTKFNPFYRRIGRATFRLTQFIYYLVFNKIDIVLIFSSHGWSVVEKGLMVILGKYWAKPVIFAPRSGFILRDIEQNKFFKKYLTFILRKVDKVIYQGPFWKSHYEKISDRNNGVIIPNWIETDRVIPLSKPDPTIHLLYLGRIATLKGVLDLIRAISDLNSSPRLILHMCGEGPESKKAMQLARDLNLSDSIKFHGWVFDTMKEDMLNRADVLVLPSYFEGFPNALLEGMLYGIACIASRVGAIPDYLTHGENALLIDPGNIAQLTEALTKLICDENLRTRLGANARHTAITNHSINTAVNRFRYLFAEL